MKLECGSLSTIPKSPPINLLYKLFDVSDQKKNLEMLQSKDDYYYKQLFHLQTPPCIRRKHLGRVLSNKKAFDLSHLHFR